MERNNTVNDQKKTAVKRGRALLFLDVNRIVWFQEGATNILSIELPQDAIKHLEVIKNEEMYTAIKNSIVQNKIPPSDAIIILSAKLLFTQDIPITADPKKDTEAIDAFLGIVPFEDVGHLILKSPKAHRVITANQAYYEMVKNVLSDEGFTPLVISPITVLGDQYANISTVDGKLAATLIQQIEVFKKNSMIPVKKFIDSDQNDNDDSPVDTEETPGKPNKMRIYALAGVFGILLLVLGVMVYTMVLTPAPSAPLVRANPAKKATPFPTATPILSNEDSSTSAQINSELRVQILYAGQVSDTKEIEQALEDAGLSDIRIQNAGGVTVTDTQVAFSSSVEQKDRDAITQLVEDLEGNIVTKDDDTGRYDVTITLRK